MTRFWYIPAVVTVGLVLLTFRFGYAPAGTDDKAWLALPSSAQHAVLRSIGLPEFNEGTTDVLLIPYPAQAEQPDVWYDMFGRKLDSAPTIQGLYIHNGKTISIK